ncbi:MAG: H-NS histone family protein [Pseudomonadota bacterium]
MSTTVLAGIQAKIAELEAEAQKLRTEAAAERQKEIAVAVEEILSKMAEYGLSAKDLGLSTGGGKIKRAGAVKAAKTPSTASGPLYRGPNGETWTGGSRGRKPQWLTKALAEGKQLSDLVAA